MSPDSDKRARPEPGLRPADVSKVVVGSRAEAKALRKRAEDDAIARAKRAKARGRAEHTGAIMAERARADASEGIVGWSVPEAAVVLGVLALTLIAKGTVQSIPTFALMPESGQIALRAALLALFYSLQLGTLVWLARRHGSGIAESFGLRRLRRGFASHAVSVSLVIALAVATRLASTAFGAAAQNLGWDPPVRSTMDFPQLFGPGGAGIVLSAIMLVVLGPIVEELVFRGVILKAADARLGAAWAIVIQAALFAAYHVTPWLLIPSFMLGLACGWIAWSRRSLWPAIVLHALYNGMAVAAAFYVAR